MLHTPDGFMLRRACGRDLTQIKAVGCRHGL